MFVLCGVIIACDINESQLSLTQIMNTNNGLFPKPDGRDRLFNRLQASGENGLKRFSGLPSTQLLIYETCGIGIVLSKQIIIHPRVTMDLNF